MFDFHKVMAICSNLEKQECPLKIVNDIREWAKEKQEKLKENYGRRPT